MSERVWDFVVIGSGVIGVSIARELKRRHGGQVLVIEKEKSAGQHASGRNSGVLHTGVYYTAGSLKARLCVEGNRRMREYCLANRLPMVDKGKVIVTRHEGELLALRELHKRSQANGVRVSLINEQTLREIEPCATTVGHALFVQDTAVVNPQKVMEAMVAEAVRESVNFRYGCEWRGAGRDGAVETSQGRIAYGHLINCGGLFADRVAHAYGVGQQYRVLPFRGHFCRLRIESSVRVNGNIYPVPDLHNPFLGIHFTRRPDGEVAIGPSALPLLGREQYRGFRRIRPVDGMAMVRYLARLWGKNRDHFRSLAWDELAKVSRRGFYGEAEGLVTGLKIQDLLPAREPGIRAQLINTVSGELVNDFVVETGPNSTHVLNAVSPAFTGALPFAEYVVEMIKP